MARDYKNARSSGGRSGGMSASGGFVIGLLLGLTVATAIYIYDRRPGTAIANRAPLSNEQEASTSAKPTPESAQSDTQYDFYEVLPKMEVEVSENKQSNSSTGGAIDTPGSYILQVGSYRNHADADRVRAKLAIQGVESSIQKIAVDGEEWNRVRIGPISNLNKLEDTRRKLREAQIDALVIKQR